MYSNTNTYCLIGYTGIFSGYIFHLGSRAISWASKKQPIVTISSIEVEHVAATIAPCQEVSLQRVLKELQQGQEEPTPVYCDNNSAIALSKNHVFHHKNKHINTSYHFIRELVKNREIYLKFCKSKHQLVNIFTKPLAKDVFEYHRQNLGVVHIDCN